MGSSSNSQSQSEDEIDALRKKASRVRNGKISREQSSSKGKLSPRSDADGATNPPRGNSENSSNGKVNQLASRSAAPADAKLKARPMNRTVLALREESKKDTNRMSNASFEAASFGNEGICLSDSCCEEFSSSGSDNDGTKAWERLPSETQRLTHHTESGYVLWYTKGNFAVTPMQLYIWIGAPFKTGLCNCLEHYGGGG